jgi:ribosomal protein S18 acetylase RimI-like enzyme
MLNTELLGHYFAAPYAVIHPEHCFTLTMAGMPIGYIVGTHDSCLFEQETEEQWWPALRQEYAMPDESDLSVEAAMVRSLHRGYRAPDYADDYPAHLHINILPSGQGRGLGRQLIDRFQVSLIDKAVTGLHFGVSPLNESAIGFYQNLGFDLLKHSNDGPVFTRRFTSARQVL